MQPNAAPAEFTENADAEYRLSTNHVAINWQGRGLVTLVLRLMGFPPRRWEALTLGYTTAETLVTTLQNSPGLGEGGHRLAAAFAHVLERDPVLVLIEEGPHIQAPRELLAEEIFHRAQYTVAGGDEALALSAAATKRLRLHPASVKAVRYAQEEDGALYGSEELAVEIPAKLARGPDFWKRAGIAPKQARTALDLYFALVEREHGKRAADTLRRTAEELLNGSQQRQEDTFHGESPATRVEGSDGLGRPGEGGEEGEKTGPGR